MSMKRIISCVFRFIWIIPANYIITYALYYCAVYWLIPNIGLFIPPIGDYFKMLENTESGTLMANYIIFDICACNAIFLATIISFYFSKSTRQNFIRETKCFVTYKEGVRYHIKKYKYEDIAMIFLLCLLNIIVAFVCNDSMICPFAVAMYRFPTILLGKAGIFLGSILFIVMMSFAVILAVYASQRKWRAIELLW